MDAGRQIVAEIKGILNTKTGSRPPLIRPILLLVRRFGANLHNAAGIIKFVGKKVQKIAQQLARALLVGRTALKKINQKPSRIAKKKIKLTYNAVSVPGV